MDLDNFYSENPLSSWKVVLGSKMHYHYGTTGKKPFEQAVLDVMKFIPPNSKVLDCGCGWGAAGRVLLKNGHSVTGVTISKQQAEYIKEFPVIHADLHNFVPDQEYDTAIFLESYFHLTDPVKVFDNLVPFVKHIVIMDIVCSQVRELPEWGITVGPKEYIFGNLRKAGYVVEENYERLNFSPPTLKYWGENISKLPPEKVFGHIAQLKALCDVGDLGAGGLDVRQIFIHAKRR